ncbi:MAG: glycosyltransferase family 2 protein [Rickettsiales bacterium]|nr:glycosyltransferase family 2 protein [Rickettsiales bacterium]
MTSVKVSTLVPVFNEEYNLAKCLDSILNSEIDFNMEVLICNDCSTDGTLLVAENYKRKFPNIVRVFSNTRNLGNGKSFAKLLSKARGEYFHVLDADDVWNSNKKLAKQVKFLDNNGDYVCAAHNTKVVDKITGKTTHIITDSQAKSIGATINYKDILRGDIYFHTSSVLFRNIYREKVPSFFYKKWGGGDVIRLKAYCFKGGKVKYFHYVWSTYNFTGKGIWSSLSKEIQLKKMIKYCWLWLKITPSLHKIYTYVHLCKFVCALMDHYFEKNSNIINYVSKKLCLFNLKFAYTLSRLGKKN